MTKQKKNKKTLTQRYKENNMMRDEIEKIEPGTRVRVHYLESILGNEIRKTQEGYYQGIDILSSSDEAEYLKITSKADSSSTRKMPLAISQVFKVEGLTKKFLIKGETYLPLTQR